MPIFQLRFSKRPVTGKNNKTRGKNNEWSISKEHSQSPAGISTAVLSEDSGGFMYHFTILRQKQRSLPMKDCWEITEQGSKCTGCTGCTGPAFAWGSKCIQRMVQLKPPSA